MDRETFSRLMHRLTVVFKVESRANEDLLELTRQYYKHFAHEDPAVLEKAVDLIIETHPVREMPTPAELRKAMVIVREDRPVKEKYLNCNVCQNMAWYIDEESGKAVLCKCERGQRVREGGRI